MKPNRRPERLELPDDDNPWGDFWFVARFVVFVAGFTAIAFGLVYGLVQILPLDDHPSERR